MNSNELHPQEFSTQKLCRAGGVLYLVLIACGIFAELAVISKLVAANDVNATASNVLTNEMLFRSGVVAHIVTLLCSTLLLGILAKLFWVVSNYLTITIISFNTVAVAIEAVSILYELQYLSILTNTALQSIQSSAEINAIAYTSLRMQSTGYDLALLFFGVVCIAIGILIMRSKLFPQWIGVLMILAGICYITNSVMAITVPAIRKQFLPFILIPCFIAELSLAIHMVKGTRTIGAE